jgi:NDP-sugar pyrophosphorylase family protein
MMINQVVILAGGLGTRLQGVAGNIPKALVPMAGRPFIEHQFQLLALSEVKDVLLCIGYLGDQVEAHIGNGARFGLRVQYAHEDPTQLLGTGGALVNALPLLQERFAVMYGDSYLPIDYAAFWRAFEQSGCPALMSVFRNASRWDASNTRVAEGRVIFYDKRAPVGAADCIDYGLTAFDRTVIQAYAHHALPLDMAVILRDLVNRRALAAWTAPHRFYEIGKPEGLTELEELIERQEQNRKIRLPPPPESE